MKLPWVGRLAFEQVASERDHLRTLVVELADQIARIARVSNGMMENKRVPREPDPMPTDLRRYIQGYGSDVTRKNLSESVHRARRDGRSWEEIQQEVMGESPPDA